MKYGLMLATGQLGWEATPEVAGRLWRRLRDRMASCDLDVVNLHGFRALYRFMYTEHGFAMPTLGVAMMGVAMMGVATCTTGRLPQNCGNDLQNETMAGQAVVRPVLLPGGCQV